jgi:negative regulator of genetic competence, sporulation and motility
MRILFCLLTFAFISSAGAQDFCKHITKEESPDKKLVDYNSPLDPDLVTNVRVTRTINLDPDYESDNFFIVFKITGNLDSVYTKNSEGEQVEKEEKKLVVEFDDKTSIVDDTVKVSHDVTDDKLYAVRYVYYPVVESNSKDFMSKKIKKISLAGYDQTIPADKANAIMHYVECIKAAK